MIDAILSWNKVSLDVTRNDFTSSDPSIDPSPQQGGPTRTSRALAIVHLAMYDAYVGIRGGTRYLSYSSTETPGTADLQAAQAAVATAASLTLISLFSRQRDFILREHQNFIAMLQDQDPNIALGITWGRLVAEKILRLRQNDGSDVPDDFYTPSPEAGRHRVDPVNPGQAFLGPLWSRVRPFGISNLNDQVPGMPPPALNSARYAQDYNEVMQKGRSEDSTRTTDETTVGIFWAYDGARNIGVPPRLYNQVVRAITLKNQTSESENARLFAMVNVALADAGIQTWAEKYKFNVWRPVLGIREADRGWGPTGRGDGNPETAGEPLWHPLGSPPTNQPSKSAATPNFPAYPSGHATFGTAAIRIAALVLGLPDDFEFEVVSDEFDGSAVGSTGVRARHARRLTIASSIEENVLSRVWLGVHWRFDGREGQNNGEIIAAKINAAFPAMA